MIDALSLIQGAADGAREYGHFPGIGGRGAVWIAAQIHLMFAAFVLGVPMFVVITEFIGIIGKDSKYDKLSKEFTRLLVFAYSATALWGVLLLFFLSTLYPRFWGHMAEIFHLSMWIYAGLFFIETLTLYLYYYGWDKWKEGRAKWGHWGLGLLLNVWGTAVMFIANAWLTYMMSPPEGTTVQGLPEGVGLWNAIANATWMPINIHRMIANAVFGGSIVAAYAAYRFLAAKTDEERAHYDWMGYVGTFIAISTFIVLPFAGYYLGREIYEYSQQMGITMMGGFMSWLWILQAILIGVLFLSANYYLWTGMGRIPGAERFMPYTKWMLVVLIISWMVWSTPNTLIATRDEFAAMGGSRHPLLGVLGLMSAKNTAVNFMILTTFLSFLLYRRANKIPTVPWAKTGTLIQGAMFVLSGGVVLFLGIIGYKFQLFGVSFGVETITRVAVLSPLQVVAVLACIIGVTVIDLFILRGAGSRGEIRWGKMPERSQYAIFVLAITFTWLMGLMGFARSGIRQHWHVWEVMRDTSDYAVTPALGYAANMITVCVVIFLSLVTFIFWLGSLAEGTASESKAPPLARQTQPAARME